MSKVHISHTLPKGGQWVAVWNHAGVTWSSILRIGNRAGVGFIEEYVEDGGIASLSHFKDTSDPEFYRNPTHDIIYIKLDQGWKEELENEV